MTYTIVYAGDVRETYVWDEDSYQAVAAAGLRWQAVVAVLRARPRIRSHIGAVLRIAAPADDGRWIVVALVERHDDEYLVVSARPLAPDEAATAARMIGGSDR